MYLFYAYLSAISADFSSERSIRRDTHTLHRSQAQSFHQHCAKVLPPCADLWQTPRTLRLKPTCLAHIAYVNCESVSTSRAHSLFFRQHRAEHYIDSADQFSIFHANIRVRLDRKQLSKKIKNVALHLFLSAQSKIFFTFVIQFVRCN